MANLYDEARTFGGELLKRDKQAHAAMVNAYRPAYARLSREIDEVRAALNRLADSGVARSQWQYLIHREARLDRLRTLTLEQISRFGKSAEIIIVSDVEQAVTRGAQHARALTEIALPPQSLAVAPALDPEDVVRGVSPFAPETVTLPTEAVQFQTSTTRAGGAIADLIAPLGEQAIRGVTESLNAGLVMGHNPRKIARAMRDAAGMPLTRALTISRTETLRAYREGSRAWYNSPGRAHLLNGWTWISAADANTCASCWAQHGKVYPLDQPMATHPNCRCTLAPATKSWEELGYGPTPEDVRVPTGDELFARLPAHHQRKVLGRRGYNDYKIQRTKLGDYVQHRQHPRWGKSTSKASARQAEKNAEARRAGIEQASVPTPPPAAEPAAPGATDAAGRVLSQPGDHLAVYKTASTPAREAAMVQEQIEVLNKALRIPDFTLHTGLKVSGKPGFGEPGKMAVTVSKRAKSRGRFTQWTSRDGKVLDAGIDLRAGGMDSGTLLHEFGHAIDYDQLMGAGAGRGLPWSSQAAYRSGVSERWAEAIANSRAIRELRESTMQFVEPARYNYFMDDTEVFARAFAQYVAEKHGSSAMREAVQGVFSQTEAAYGVRLQWDADDFAPIARAFDDLFRELGWMN